MLADLGIVHAMARTPQSHGRIDRLYATLHNSLPIELRLRGIRTIEEANAVLPELIDARNERFPVEPASNESAYRELEHDADIEHVLARREESRVYDGCSFS